MPQICQHVRTANLKFSGLWVFRFVDHVAINRQIHDVAYFGLFEGLTKRGQILSWIAIEH